MVYQKGSASLFNDLLRADLGTAPAVQTAVLVDNDRLPGNVNALLRTDGIAQLTADTAAPHKVAGLRGCRLTMIMLSRVA